MIRIRRCREAVLAFLLLIAIFFPASLFAQIDTGGITGTVTDPTGAVVSGATVTLTNTATSVPQTTRSTSTGTYSFTGVRPGTYSLEAEAPGFETFIDHGLLIHVQQTLTVDVHFVTGAVSQQVTVTAAAPLLQAENAAVGQTITTQAVNDLPLQTRDWASLAQLSAGVATAPVGQPSSDSGSSTSAFFSVDGVNLWQNDFRLNGINDNIEVYGGSSVGSDAAITPPPDVIQEFKLQSGDFNAEFGHSTGAVVNAVIKSGTNTSRVVAPGAVDPISGLTNNSSGTVYVRDPFYTGGSLFGITNFTGLASRLNIIPAGRIDQNAVKLLGVYPAPTSLGLPITRF
jgi:Carboxypeptidase regulatory-like domain